MLQLSVETARGMVTAAALLKGGGRTCQDFAVAAVATAMDRSPPFRPRARQAPVGFT